MKYITVFLLCITLASCAYRGDLKTPTQIEIEQKKKAEKEAKAEAKKEKRLQKESQKKEEQE